MSEHDVSEEIKNIINNSMGFTLELNKITNKFYDFGDYVNCNVKGEKEKLSCIKAGATAIAAHMIEIVIDGYRDEDILALSTMLFSMAIDNLKRKNEALKNPN